MASAPAIIMFTPCHCDSHAPFPPPFPPSHHSNHFATHMMDLKSLLSCVFVLLQDQLMCDRCFRLPQSLQLLANIRTARHFVLLEKQSCQQQARVLLCVFVAYSWMCDAVVLCYCRGTEFIMFT